MAPAILAIMVLVGACAGDDGERVTVATSTGTTVVPTVTSGTSNGSMVDTSAMDEEIGFTVAALGRVRPGLPVARPPRTGGQQ